MVGAFFSAFRWTARSAGSGQYNSAISGHYVSVKAPHDLTDTLDKGIVVIADAYKYCNLCCLYRLDIDERNKIIRLPPPAIDGFGDHAIIILDENKFVSRIAKQMKKNIEWKYLLGDVNYRKEINDDTKSRIYFKSINTIKVDSICDGRKSLRSRDCFDKVEKFSYQHEWRLCLLKDCNDSMPYTLKIGDISDIAIIVKTKELRKIMLEMYQNYSIGEVLAQREAYQGNISRREFREAIYDIDDKAYIAFSIG